MMGLRNLMLKKNEAADSGLEVTVFSQQSSSVTKPSAVTCKNVTELSSFINYSTEGLNIYFPNVQSVHDNALKGCYLYQVTVHLNADYKTDITGSSYYPVFGGNDGYPPDFVFDINAAKLTVNKSSDVTTLWIDGLTSTAAYDWIPKNKDVPIVAVSDTAVLVDTINTPTDLTYTVTMPTSNPVGINVTDVEGTASTTIKYGSNNLTSKTGLNPYLYAPNGTTLSFDMILTTNDGAGYHYANDLASFVDITTADMEEISGYFEFGNQLYMITDTTLTSMWAVQKWIRNNCEGVSPYGITKLMHSGITSLIDVDGLSGYEHLTEVTLPKCTSIGENGVDYCTALTTIRLASCTSLVKQSFYGCDNLTSIHFAAANQATIEALSGYSSKFGASSATIYFDL